MKKSITENKNMTFTDLIKLYIYRPYNDVLKMMVDKDERVHIKGDTWIVILDHNTGDFHFEGTINRYYDIDMIESIRDCFGDIYSVFNFKYDEVERDTWITIEDVIEDTSGKKTLYDIQFEDEDKKKRMLQRKKEYYWAHKAEINKRQREYYKKRNQIA